MEYIWGFFWELFFLFLLLLSYILVRRKHNRKVSELLIHSPDSGDIYINSNIIEDLIPAVIIFNLTLENNFFKDKLPHKWEYLCPHTSQNNMECRKRHPGPLSSEG